MTDDNDTVQSEAAPSMSDLIRASSSRDDRQRVGHRRLFGPPPDNDGDAEPADNDDDAA